MIVLCNARSTAAWNAQPLSIAVQDANKGGLACLAPTWAMVGGLKRGLGDQRDWCMKHEAITVQQYVDAYRQLVLDRRVEIVQWVKGNRYNSHALYCYCPPVPGNFDVNDFTGQVWFCHRLLVFHLLRRWFPSLEVNLF